MPAAPSPADLSALGGMFKNASPEGGDPEGGGDASELVADISGKLTQLAQMLGDSPAATESDKSAISDIIGQFQGFVTNNLSQGSGQDAPVADPSPMGGGPAGMEAGVANVAPVL